jgi:hypothetical protein
MAAASEELSHSGSRSLRRLPPAACLGSDKLLTHIDDRREVVAVRYFLSDTVDVNQYRPARVVLGSLETLRDGNTNRRF